MKKKMGALILSLVLLVSLSAFGLIGLTGCAEKYDLYVAGLNGAYGKEHWKELEKGFEKATGKKVKLVIESNIENIIEPQISAGSGPDVVYLAKGRSIKLTEKLLSSDQIMDVTDLLSTNVRGGTKTIAETLTADAKAGMKEADGTTRLLPLFVGLNGLFFNADKFYANDGDGSYSGVKDGKYELPNTWKEFKELGASLTDINSVSLFTYPTAGYLDALIPASIATNAGEAKLAQCFNYTDGIWEDEQVNQVFKELAAIKPYIYPNTVENGIGDQNFKQNQQSVIDGKTLFMCNGDWVKGEMVESTPAGFNWGTIPYLAFNDDQARYSSTVYEQMYIMKDTKNADLAKEFVQYVYSDEGQTIIANKSNAAMLATNNYYGIATGKISDAALAGYKGYYDGSMKTTATNGWATVSNLPGKTPGWTDTFCGNLANVWAKTDAMTADAWIAELERVSDIYRAHIVTA